MLKLKRRRQQWVRIGPDVTVKIVAIQNGAVTLEIEAPAAYLITRSSSVSASAEQTVAATQQ